MDILAKHKGKIGKRIILITDVGAPSNTDQLEVLVDQMNAMDIKLQILSVIFFLSSQFSIMEVYS